jgi:DNA mismatch endonuclease (patch repair protein)
MSAVNSSFASSPAVRGRMQAQPSKNTGLELRLRRILHARGLRYRVHRPPVAGLRRTADLVFTRGRVAVYLDGCFWHGCREHMLWPRANADFWRVKIERNRSRDSETDARLTAAGWVPFRVWEHEDMNDAADRLNALLAERRGVGTA